MTTFCSIHRYTVMADGACPDCFVATAEAHPEVAGMFAARWGWAAAGAVLARLVSGLATVALLAFIAATIWKAWSK